MANQVIKQIISNAMFDSDLLAEEVTYNSVTINAIVEIGATEVEKSPGMYHQLNTTVIYDEGLITVSTDDIPTPKRGDKVVYNGKTYFVDSVYLLDSNGGNVTVKVKAEERGYMRK